MKRVRGCSHLYLRGQSYIYRRAVPSDVRAAFGGRGEVQKSLGTTSLAEARHLMNDQQRLFEQTLSDARGVISPIEKIHRQVALPSVQDMEIAVRQWLAGRIERERNAIAVKTADEEDTYLADLPLQQLQWDSAAKRGPITPHLSTQWIAEGLAEEHGWDLKPNTSAYRSLLRLISRAQFEAAERIRQELEGEAVRALDQRFSPENYLSDASRPVAGTPKDASLKGLLGGFMAERKPASATVKSYTRQFNAFCDFIGHDSAAAISPEDIVRITPEAGSVKSYEAREVALHPQVIDQGFLKFIEGKAGPLFYNPKRHRGGSAGNPQPKKVGEFLARWVRDLGVDDPNVQPNHGWRHRFATLARRHGIAEEIRYAILGHVRADDL